MAPPSIKESVVAVIGEHFSVGTKPIIRETFLDSFLHDSIDNVLFLVELSLVFDISIPDDVFTAFKTVGDVIDYVSSNCPIPAT